MPKVGAGVMLVTFSSGWLASMAAVSFVQYDRDLLSAKPVSEDTRLTGDSEVKWPWGKTQAKGSQTAPLDVQERVDVDVDWSVGQFKQVGDQSFCETDAIADMRFYSGTVYAQSDKDDQYTYAGPLQPYGPWNAVDGKPETRWQSPPGGVKSWNRVLEVSDHWIEVDLAHPMALERIFVRWEPGYLPDTWYVTGSESWDSKFKGKWDEITLAKDVHTNTTSEHIVGSRKKKQYRYVRVVCEGFPNVDGCSMGELKVFTLHACNGPPWSQGQVHGPPPAHPTL